MSSTTLENGRWALSLLYVIPHVLHNSGANIPKLLCTMNYTSVLICGREVDGPLWHLGLVVTINHAHTIVMPLQR